MNMRKILSLIIFLLALTVSWELPASISNGVNYPPPSVNMPLNGCENNTCRNSLKVNGVSREFYSFTPKISPRRLQRDPPALIIILHDSSSTAGTFPRNVLHYNLNNLATQFGFMVVYPQALNNHWNFGAESGSTADDEDFIGSLIHYFQENYKVNPGRVYVAGMGNGGIMAMHLGCQMSGQINSIAVVNAAMPISMAATCRFLKPVSALFIESRADAFLPWNGNVMYDLPGFPTPRRLTVPATISTWALLDKLYVSHKYNLVPSLNPDGSWVYNENIQGATNHPQVQFLTVYGAGHTWPGGGQYLPQRYVGNVSHNLNASAVIWDFFEFHR